RLRIPRNRCGIGPYGTAERPQFPSRGEKPPQPFGRHPRQTLRQDEPRKTLASKKRDFLSGSLPRPHRWQRTPEATVVRHVRPPRHVAYLADVRRCLPAGSTVVSGGRLSSRWVPYV